ncbi:MAG: COX15/CtaA family protein [Anaerolineales bacterium]|uniref:COX15/CtaA family protein n=1 Tax=Candidatus Villigracilis proximus TaxID=3140683 RepID=UPI0031355B5E|nr:COX15/CtaA family protein [Anaerolineales bacterium]
MLKTQNNAVMKWLYIFAVVVAFLVVFGGFVRLTRSGLSIVEWNPISGAMPPIGQQAWEEEFAKYQLTPEYLKINTGMTLERYKFIFYMEWFHRNVARTAGLVYAFPVFYFLFKKIIPFKEFGIYFLMGMLFISQAFAGWIMVASGLVDRPAVSHFNLTIHLLLALTLFGLALWTAFGHKYGFHDSSKKAKWSLPTKLSWVALGLLVIQITYGGFTAGLKAGHVSDTWPLMLGALIPPNLFNSWINVFETPQTIVFIHRWFAWTGMILVPVVYYIVKKQNYPADIQTGLKWLIGVVALQITLGVLTILSYVNIVIALIHQANAILLLGLAVYFIHRFRALDEK